MRNEAHPYPCLSKPLAGILDHLVLADAHRLEIQLTACRRLVDLVMAAQSRADHATRRLPGFGRRCPLLGDATAVLKFSVVGLIEMDPLPSFRQP